MGKGWERASFEFNTRPNRVERNISRRDLLIPSGTGLTLFADCMACGALLGLLFWFPLSLTSFLMGGDQPWLWWTIGGASLGLGLLLFAYARWDLVRFMRSLDES
jgi:hypothetical protein